MPRAAKPPEPVTPERIERALLAAQNRDPDALREILAPAVVWHTPSHNMIGGDHMGREQAVQHLRDQRDLTRGSLHAEERETLRMAGAEGSVTMHVVAVRGERRLDLDEEIRLRLEDGRVAEMWSVPRDPAAWDRFWSA